MPNQQRIKNFGRNVQFTPRYAYAPRTEDEVLAILNRHADQTFRVVGRLHAWSEAASTDTVSIDIRHLNKISVESANGQAQVSAGGGCRISQLLHELRVKHNLTTPTVGLIDRQTIAGAISTGTHGSGRHSFSHYIESVRLAIFDGSGQAIVRTIEGGDALRAIRCALGCMGVILSVTFRGRSVYRVEEDTKLAASIDQALKLEKEYPLQQLYFIPWSWDIFVHCRRETNSPRSWYATLYQLHWLLGIDIGLHLLFRFLARTLRSARLSRFFLRTVLKKLTIQNWRVVDRSDRILTMAHSLFRHIEIEIFVTRDKLPEVLGFLENVLPVIAGVSTNLTSDWQRQLQVANLQDGLKSIKGVYSHHYPICVRRVMPDDTLISMASGSEDRYALSFISYQHPNDRAGFQRFAEFLARSTTVLFAARPHWGKVCPIDRDLAEQLYPDLPRFRTVCETVDPLKRFSNAWTRSFLLTDFANPTQPNE